MLPQPFIRIEYLRFTMRGRFTFAINAYKYHLINSKDNFLANLVAHLAHQGNGGTAEVRSFHPQLNNIALFGRTYEIDLRHIFGHHALGA